jgi:hypothetical protein
MTALWQTEPNWLEVIAQVRLRPALSLLGFLLTPVAVVVGGIGAWRFGADAGWTNAFFITDGVLSHWQIWCVFAIVMQAGAYSLNRRIADREPPISAQIGRGLGQVRTARNNISMPPDTRKEPHGPRFRN